MGLVLLGFLFETPLAAALTVGAAASLPVLIHLLNRKRYRVVTWAAMRFLLAAQKKNIRRMRLEQLLLLVVRTLLVLLLVVAMASVLPWAEALWHRVLPGGAARAMVGARRTYKVLVLDGSFSMAARAGEQACFDRARSLALQVLREASGGDGFSVVLQAAPPRRVVPGPSLDAHKVAEEIQALNLPHGNADLVATLHVVEDLLRQAPAKFEEREVYFFTDLQQATWTARQAVDPAPVLQKIQALARTIFVSVGGETVANTAVTSLALGVPFVTTGGPTPLVATLHHYGTEPRKQARVELLVGRARAAAGEPPCEPRVVEQRLLDLAPGAQPVSFEYRFPAAGDYAVQVRLEGDVLELDDTRTAVVAVKESVPVLLVNGKPATEPYDQATEWLRDALNPYRTGPVPRSVAARPRVLSEAEFADAGLGDLTGTDCVFLCDVPRVGVAELRRLENHLRRGGGVVFCLGPRVDLEAYNRLLYRNGEGILPAQLRARQPEPKHHAFTFHVEGDEKGYAEPPLRAFARASDRASLLAARFRQYVRAEVEPRGRARKVLSFRPELHDPDPKARALASEEAAALPAGDPAVVEWQRHRGRVFLLTSTVNMDWTSWPISPSFPAFMQEVLHVAVAGRLREQALVVGEPLEEFLPAGGIGLDVTVVTPDGRVESVRTQTRDETNVFTWGETDRSGLYRATVGQHPQEYLFAVNVPTATDSQQACESDLTRTNRAELHSAFPGWDFQLVTDLRDVVHSGGPALDASLDSEGRGAGVTAARGLLLGVLVLALLEVVLAWRFGHYTPLRAPLGEPPGGGRLLPAAVAAGAGTAFLVLAVTLLHAAWTGDFLGFLPDSFRTTVESRLGTPPPAPGEGARWHLEFTPYLWDASADPWLAAGLALVVAALVVSLVLHEGQTAGPGYKLLLAGLRLFFFLLLLAVLLPQVKLWFERQGWPDVAILVDDSRSMATTDRYRNPAVQEAATRLADEAGLASTDRLRLAQALVTQARPDWLETLLTRRKVKVHLYRASTGAARLAALNDPQRQEEAVRAVQELRPEGESSQLGAAVRQVLNDFRGSSLAAIVLLTDGVTTEGEDLVRVSRYAAQVGVPLYYVGIGDAYPVRDLILHDLQVEDAVHVNDRLVFEGRLTAQGYPGFTVPVRLREKGKSQVLAEQSVKTDANGHPVKFRLTHQPTEPGEKTYVLDVPVQDDEIKPAHNNRLERTVFVREAKVLKVLYIEGEARYEYRFVKHLLERESDRDKRNKTIDLHVLLLDADEEYAVEDRSALADFPSKRELEGYDVVLLGDADPKHRKLGEKNLRHLADFVRERGGGLLLIAGERYNPRAYQDTPLRDVLPIEMVGPPPAEVDHPTGYRPELTAVGRFHPLFRFSPDEGENASVWNALAELHWWADGYRARPAAEVLAVHPQRVAPDPRRPGGSGTERLPLIVQQFVGAGRCLFFGVDETWRWRYRDKELRFNQFWIQTIRYLARSRLGRIDLHLDRQTPYRRGEPIKATVRFPDDAPPPDPDTEVKVRVERTSPRTLGKGETEIQTLQLAKVEGTRATYEGLLTQTPEGEYRFWLSAPTVPPPQPRAECQVLPPPGELEQLQMNQADMERSARETHGRFYTLADAGRLPEELPAGARVVLHAPLPPWLLWNHGAVFGLALGLLGAEWVLRKRRHLV